MKKYFFVLFFSFFLLSCGEGKKDGFDFGERVCISQDCIGAIDKDSFSQMNKYCNRKDVRGLEIMEAKGLITILKKGTTGVITEMSFGMYKIRLNDDREFWCAQEFVTKTKQ